jgi:hypothetical protein
LVIVGRRPWNGLFPSSHSAREAGVLCGFIVSNHNQSAKQKNCQTVGNAGPRHKSGWFIALKSVPAQTDGPILTNAHGSPSPDIYQPSG